MTNTTNFALSDKVKLSDYYLSNYRGVEHLRDSNAEVVGITRRAVQANELSKDMLHMYVEHYGVMPIYDIIGLLIKYQDTNVSFLVSPFGVVRCEST